MNPDLQQTLLHFLHQISDNPDSIPAIPIEQWQEGSNEWQIMTSVHTVLQQLIQSKQEAKREVEEQLRNKEAQYRSIFEAVTDALFIADLDDGCVVEANPAACAIYGYSYTR